METQAMLRTLREQTVNKSIKDLKESVDDMDLEERKEFFDSTLYREFQSFLFNHKQVIRDANER